MPERSLNPIQLNIKLKQWSGIEENVSLTANKFDVNRKRVREWNAKYQLAGQCHEKQKKKVHRGKNTQKLTDCTIIICIDISV